LGRLTIQPLAVRAVPDPNNPGQIQVQVALGAGAQALTINGIVLNVLIGVDRWTAESLRAQSLQVPNPSPFSAMVDTGASGLALDNSIIQALNLTRRGLVRVHTASGSRLANLYVVSLSFPATELRSYDVVRATEVDLSAQPFKCLIGREIMANWHVHYNGQTGAISISD